MSGGGNCINTMMWFDPKTELGFIFIGNTGHSATNRVNHILIFNALVSIGNSIPYEDGSLVEKIQHRWHNISSRLKSIL